MKEEDALFQYLDTSSEREVAGMIIKSPYVGVLQEARKATNRDIYSGEKVINTSHGSWLGAVGYLIAVDHTGDRFSVNNKNKQKKLEEIEKITKLNSFIKTLIVFSSLSTKEIFALYALRCSFIHDYALFNNKRKEFIHHFSVTQGQPGKLVIFPKKHWDGKMENRKEYNTTIVNLELFGDLVENTHLKLMKLADQSKLKILNKEKLDFITYQKR